MTDRQAVQTIFELAQRLDECYVIEHTHSQTSYLHYDATSNAYECVVKAHGDARDPVTADTWQAIAYVDTYGDTADGMHFAPVEEFVAACPPDAGSEVGSDD